MELFKNLANVFGQTLFKGTEQTAGRACQLVQRCGPEEMLLLEPRAKCGDRLRAVMDMKRNATVASCSVLSTKIFIALTANRFMQFVGAKPKHAEDC